MSIKQMHLAGRMRFEGTVTFVCRPASENGGATFRPGRSRPQVICESVRSTWSQVRLNAKASPQS
jgi:hypothetical protein